MPRAQPATDPHDLPRLERPRGPQRVSERVQIDRGPRGVIRQGGSSTNGSLRVPPVIELPPVDRFYPIVEPRGQLDQELPCWSLAQPHPPVGAGYLVNPREAYVVGRVAVLAD